MACRTAAGYEVRFVPQRGWRFLKEWDDPFYLAAGDSAYCFTSVFAPRGIQVPVRHIWRRYDDGSGWITTDRIAFDVSGGREGGYRGFTRKRRLVPGDWRVEVETEEGLILGRIDFTIVRSQAPHPPLESRIIN